jgi:type II secretory pathway component PulK
MRRRARGSSLLLVLGILTVFGLVLGVLATVLLADLSSSRRRANEQYASDLARSGTDWARGTLMARGGLPSATLRVEGGDITVATEELPDGRLRVVSTGRVREGESVLAARREVAVFGSPATVHP